MLGIVKPSHREAFKVRLQSLGLDPYSMREILTVHDLRTRVYILKNGKPFMSISLDKVHSRIWWAKVRFTEIEPELNEIAFTDADPETRKYMESVLAQIVSEIREACPYIESDLTPKYNKTLNAAARWLPFVQLLAWADLLSTQAMLFVLGAVALLAFVALRYAVRGMKHPTRGVARLRSAS